MLSKLFVFPLVFAKSKFGLDTVSILDPYDHENALLSQLMSTVELDALYQHGCWCRKLGFGLGPTGGEPVDELDKACKHWIESRSCLEFPNGSCENGITEISYDIDYSFQTPEEQCASNIATCMKDLCILDAYWLEEIIQFFNNGLPNIIPTTSCSVMLVPKYEYRQCEGTSPHLHFAELETTTVPATTTTPLPSTCPVPEASPNGNDCAILVAESFTHAAFLNGAWFGSQQDYQYIYDGEKGEITDFGHMNRQDMTNNVSAYLVKTGCNLMLYSDTQCANTIGFAMCNEVFQSGLFNYCGELLPEFNDNVNYYQCDCLTRSFSTRNVFGDNDFIWMFPSRP